MSKHMWTAQDGEWLAVVEDRDDGTIEVLWMIGWWLDEENEVLLPVVVRQGSGHGRAEPVDSWDPDNDWILWMGPRSDFPEEYRGFDKLDQAAERQYPEWARTLALVRTAKPKP